MPIQTEHFFQENDLIGQNPKFCFKIPFYLNFFFILKQVTKQNGVPAYPFIQFLLILTSFITMA